LTPPFDAEEAYGLSEDEVRRRWPHAEGDLFGHFFTGTLEAAVVFARDWAERSARK
jgi:fermentation-respiration switch protein FrsA (DUF1100 family)